VVNTRSIYANNKLGVAQVGFLSGKYAAHLLFESQQYPPIKRQRGRDGKEKDTDTQGFRAWRSCEISILQSFPPLERMGEVDNAGSGLGVSKLAY
jgi:hypothetical protein